MARPIGVGALFWAWGPCKPAMARPIAPAAAYRIDDGPGPDHRPDIGDTRLWRAGPIRQHHQFAIIRGPARQTASENDWTAAVVHW